jgi:hypothetical protein
VIAEIEFSAETSEAGKHFRRRILCVPQIAQNSRFALWVEAWGFSPTKKANRRFSALALRLFVRAGSEFSHKLLERNHCRCTQVPVPHSSQRFIALSGLARCPSTPTLMLL